MKTPFKTPPALAMLLSGMLALAGAAQAGSDGSPHNRSAHTALGAAARAAHFDSTTRSESSRHQWRGKSNAEWVQAHLRWMLSIPLNVNPLVDTAGVNCGINQDGPVWFVSFAPLPTYTLTCTIPYGKAIVAPTIAAFNNYPCPIDPANPNAPPFEPAAGQTLEDFLAAGLFDVVGTLNADATLNGRPLKARRVTTPVFGFTAAGSLNAIDACITGSPQLSVSDGYFVFIDPLPRGDHVLQINSSGPGFASVGTINLKVR